MVKTLVERGSLPGPRTSLAFSPWVCHRAKFITRSWTVSVVSQKGNKVVQSDHSVTCNCSFLGLFVACYGICCLIKKCWVPGPAFLPLHPLCAWHPSGPVRLPGNRGPGSKSNYAEVPDVGWALSNQLPGYYPVSLTVPFSWRNQAIESSQPCVPNYLFGSVVLDHYLWGWGSS